MQRKRRFRSVLKALNIQVPKGNGFHAFRHADAVLMDRLNVPMKVRQQRLGHDDAKITLDVYTHTAGQDSALAATELGRIVWGKSQEILDTNRTQIKKRLSEHDPLSRRIEYDCLVAGVGFEPTTSGL